MSFTALCVIAKALYVIEVLAAVLLFASVFGGALDKRQRDEKHPRWWQIGTPLAFASLGFVLMTAAVGAMIWAHVFSMFMMVIFIIGGFVSYAGGGELRELYRASHS